ncbi:MAG: ribonuclease D [Saprospiraceae bacterium]
MNYRVHFIEEQAEFDRVMQTLAHEPWIGFDTEFVGEKSYVPVLCLIQVVSENDIYLLDTLKLKDLSAFLRLVEDPEILKITHAGDNDYRLLHTLYKTVPQNTFDTQISAGFVGYNYPAGFGKIVEKELKVNLAKSHTVADWEARPIDPKALEYAIEDVKYLPALHAKLSAKLRRQNREGWAREENRKWEVESFYFVDPYKEVFGNDYIHQLDFKGKVFLMRLYQWRRDKAAEQNVPRETILQSRHISTVIRAGKDNFRSGKSNRTISESVWRRHQSDWMELWKKDITDDETAFIQALPEPAPDDPEREWTMELLYHFVRRQCLDHEISAALLLPKGDFNKLKAGESSFNAHLLEGWRAELLGQTLVDWLKRNGRLNLDWGDQHCTLHYRS